MKRRAAALACLGVVAGADWAIARRRPPWILIGLLDEPAHLATAGLVLLNLRHPSDDWARGFMAGAALPDIDHLPLLLSRVNPSVDDPRPVTHCLLAAAPLLAFAHATSRPRLRSAARGAAAGTLAHFARDLAVGTGVNLFRPLSAKSIRVPYPVYAGALAVLAAAALARRPNSRYIDARPIAEAVPS